MNTAAGIIIALTAAAIIYEIGYSRGRVDGVRITLDYWEEEEFSTLRRNQFMKGKGKDVRKP